MSFLSAKFGNSGAELPGSVKTVRTLMWVQAVATALVSGFQVWNLSTLRGMSNAELTEASGGQINNQGDIPYGVGWTITILLLICGLALAYAAYTLTTRTRKVRTVTVILELLIAALILLTLPSLCNLAAFVLPAIVVIVMLLREPARSWFNVTGTTPGGDTKE